MQGELPWATCCRMMLAHVLRWLVVVCVQAVPSVHAAFCGRKAQLC